MEPLSNKKRRLYFYTYLIVFLALLPVVVLFVQGYRLGTGFSMLRVGGIYVGGVDSDVEVYLDGTRQENLKSLKRGFFVESLAPGTYSLSIKKEGYSQWDKIVIVVGEKVVEAYPLLTPLKIEMVNIPKQVESEGGFFSSATSTSFVDNEVFAEVSKLFEQGTTTQSIKRQRVTIWSEGASIKYRWEDDFSTVFPALCGYQNCIATSTVYVAKENINRVGFYPERNDVVLFSLSDGVYAVEIDSRSPQKIVQIYSGKNPDFRVEDDEILYIKEGEDIFQVEI